MKKAILISREGGETRACLLSSGQLVNIDAEGTSGSSTIGNIYKGKISDISRSLNAAFVDIGSPKEGFLSINDVHPAILEGFPKRPFMSEIFSRHQDVLVQVVRDPVGEKGAMLTTCISLPGRYVVLMPAVEKTGISKKLPEEERQRLREIIEEVEIPEGFGVIVRTAGQDRKKQELLTDLTELIKVWQQIEVVFNESASPSLVLQEQSLAIRFLREYLTQDVNEIVVDDEGLRKEVNAFLTVVMPKYKKMVKLYTDRLPLFVRYNVEGQIERMFLRDVTLPSGGRIVIDKTEALIAIDVNSGRHKEKDIEETALRSNLEAAQEIAIQCKLRDLGGLIVIDFIDMYQQKNRNQVQQHIKECFKDDKAKVSFGKISQFGLLEMTRQKLRSGMVSRATESCSRCGGVGYVRTIPSMGLHVLRRIREMAVNGNTDSITVTAPVDVANFMHNSLRGLLLDLERQHGIKVVILGRADLTEETIEATRRESTGRSEPSAPEPPAVTRYAGEGAAAETADAGSSQLEAEPDLVTPETAAEGKAAPPATDDQAAAEPRSRDKRRRDRGRKKKGEASTPQVDAGKPQADAGKPQADTGKAQADAGKPQADTGKAQARAGKQQPRSAKQQSKSGKPQADAGKPQADAGKPQAHEGKQEAGAAQDQALSAASPSADDAQQGPADTRSKRRRRRRRGRSGDQPIQGEPVAEEPIQGEPVADEPVTDKPVMGGPARGEPAAIDGPPQATVVEGGRRRIEPPPLPMSPLQDEHLAKDGLLDTILKRLLGLDR